MKRAKTGGASPLAKRLAAIGSLLEARFGRPDACAHEHAPDPLFNLVLTILSQNTTDANRDRAFERLAARYPTASKLASADPAELADTIRVAGLPRAKAGSILAALARLMEERGGYSLDFLREMGLEEARDYLVSFHGVGVKTANILLLFSFGFPAFPVDTHVLRVTGRLGLIPPSADLGKAALHLEPHVAPGEHGPLHLNLIRLGKEICRPATPKCAECPVLSVCPEGARRTASTAAGPGPDGKGRATGGGKGSTRGTGAVNTSGSVKVGTGAVAGREKKAAAAGSAARTGSSRG